jgi:L,D-peptidoglycan transpeptidase YkuD (ErfK/YbiS/YcfS/YnhG family)
MAIVRACRQDARRGMLEAGTLSLSCALGRTGVRIDKREGDGATPAGDWPIRRVLYRADKRALPTLPWPVSAIQPADGWCDDPVDARYNRMIGLPFPARAEQMWRDDDLYDIVVVLGHNDDPPVPGLGSAIFMHVARSDFASTEGCIALALPDLMSFLTAAPPFRVIRVLAD